MPGQADVLSGEEHEALDDGSEEDPTGKLIEDDLAAFEDAEGLEEDPNSRYIDYSCASAWEYFISDAEELLRGWMRDLSTRPHAEAALTYNERTYQVVLWNPADSSSALTSCYLDDRSLDFGKALNPVQRFLGVRSFVFVWKGSSIDSKGSGHGMNRSEAGQILSSLCIALHNCACPLPVFVPVGKTLARSDFEAEGFGGFLEADDIFGYAVPTPLALIPFTVRFEMSKTFQPPEAYKTLDGFLELFMAKVGASQGLNSSELGVTSMLQEEGAGGDPVKAQLSVSVQHSWLWELDEYDWAASSHEWRDVIAPPEHDAWRAEVHHIMATVQQGCPWLEQLWGPTGNPLRTLCLRVQWLNLQEGTFVENIFYSTLQPLQTPPSAWQLSATYAVAPLMALPSPPPSLPRSPEAVMTPLSWLLRSILASFITSQAATPGTIMAEISPPTNGAAKEEEEETPESLRRQQALMIASLLGPKMSALVSVLSMKAAPDAKDVSDLTNFLFDETTEDGSRPDDMSGEGSRDLSAWFPCMGAPLGRLVSLLALMMGSLQSLHAMAMLWKDVVRELRWRWDQALRLPRMTSPPGGAEVVPDLRACLIHQKVQLLDLCISRKRQQSFSFDDGAKSPPSLMTRALSATGSEGDAFFDSFDGAEEERQERVGVNEEASEEGVVCMLRPGKDSTPVLSPKCQEACPLTEDELQQHQQLLSQMQHEKGSGDASLRHIRNQVLLAKLFSDMQAFKAANPGAVFADFVRWRSVNDWVPLTSDPLEESLGEDDDDTKIVWPGVGKVRPSFAQRLGVAIEDILQLWTSALPSPVAAQKTLFNVPQEAEKVLHFLETISPGQLLSQVMSVSFCMAHFLLSQAGTPAVKLPLLQGKLLGLDQLINEALSLLREEQLASETLIINRELTHAVSQSTLLACDRVCDAVTDVEETLGRASSLLHSLPNQTRLVEALLRESTPVPLASEAERRAVLGVMGTAPPRNPDPPLPSEGDAEKPPSPIKVERQESESQSWVLDPAALRTYVLRCRCPTPFHHGQLGPLGLQQQRLSPPVTSRMYASVNKAEDSVRLALALSEADL